MDRDNYFVGRDPASGPTVEDVGGGGGGGGGDALLLESLDYLLLEGGTDKLLLEV